VIINPNSAKSAGKTNITKQQVKNPNLTGNMILTKPIIKATTVIDLIFDDAAAKEPIFLASSLKSYVEYVS
jgi:hypothetical protein